MVEAKFIKTNDIIYTCNICSDNIEDGNAIALKCNPNKHIYCYECIFCWFKELKKKLNKSNYTIPNMCPICRKNGGLLPIHDNYCSEYIKGIHIIPKVNTNINPLIIKKELPHYCGLKLLSKNGFCNMIGKTENNGLCGKHSKYSIYVNENIDTNNNIINKPIALDINPNKKSYECGMKLKTMNGYCYSFGKSKYNGFCGIHYKKNNNVLTNNDMTINVVETNVVENNVVETNIEISNNNIINDILIV